MDGIPDEVVKRAQLYDHDHWREDRNGERGGSWGSVPPDQVRRLLRGAYGGVPDIFMKHFAAIADALKVAEAEARHDYLRDWYRAALADVEPLAEAIAKYAGAAHNEPSGVRYVSSSDSAASGDEIS